MKGKKSAADIEMEPPTGDSSTSSMYINTPEPCCSSFTKTSRHALHNITIEPISALMTMTYSMITIISQNLMLDKACRIDLQYNNTVCSALDNRKTMGNYETQEDAVQEVVANISAWKGPVEFSLAVVFVLFIGSWSDRHGRKGVIILPCIGFTLSSIGLMINSLVPSWSAEIAALFMSLPMGLTGSVTTMWMALCSFVSDITPIETRTMRVGFIGASSSLGAGIGMLIAGELYRGVGYAWFFGITAAIDVCCIMYVIFCVHDIPHFSLQQHRNKFLDLFDCRNVWKAAKITFRKREDNKRLQLILFFFLIFSAMYPGSGEGSVLYLFTKNVLHWNEVIYGFFGMYRMFLGMLGSVFAGYLLSYKLKVPDAILGILACTAQVISGLMYAFTYTNWIIFASAVFDMSFGSGSIIFVARAMITKIVPPNELGSVYGFISASEALTPLMGIPLYTTVYANTLSTFPGAYYFLSIAATFAPYAIFIWIYVTDRRKKRKEMKLAATPTSEIPQPDLMQPVPTAVNINFP